MKIREYKIIIPNVEHKDVTGDLYVGSFLFEDTDDLELLENRAMELYPPIRTKVFKIEHGALYNDDLSIVYKTNKLFIMVRQDYIDLDEDVVTGDLVDFILFHKSYNLLNTKGCNYKNFDSWEDLQEYIKNMYNPILVKPIHFSETFGFSVFDEIPNTNMVGFAFIDGYKTKELIISKRAALNLINEAIEDYNYYFQGETYTISVFDYSTVYKEGGELVFSDIILGYKNIKQFIENELNTFLSNDLKYEIDELEELD